MFEVQYINDPLYLKIVLLEGYNFTAEIRYFRNNMENFVKPLIQEIVFLLSDFSNFQHD